MAERQVGEGFGPGEGGEPLVLVEEPALGEGGELGRAEAVPLVIGVAKLGDGLAAETGGAGMAWLVLWLEVGEAEADSLIGKEACGEGAGGLGGVALIVHGGAHDGEEAGPIDAIGAAEAEGAGLVEAGFGGQGEDVADAVEPAAAGASEHLEEFIGTDLSGLFAAAVGAVGDHNRAHGKIDTGGEAHSGDDDAELSGFGERFDEAGALAVIEAAVVKGDAGAEEGAEGMAGEFFLFGGENEGIFFGEGAGDFDSDVLGGAAARCEEEQRGHFSFEDTGDGAWPVTANGIGNAVGEGFHGNFLKGDGTFAVGDQFGGPPEAAEPVADRFGIADGAAEEKEARLWRRGGDGDLVIEAPLVIADHLVFIDDEEIGTLAVEEAGFLGFEGGDDDGGIGTERAVAGDEADRPAEGFPFEQFIVGEGAGGNGVDGAAVEAAIHEEFKDIGFAGTGGGIDDDIASPGEVAEGGLLPDIGQFEGAVEFGHGGKKPYHVGQASINSRV